MNRPYYVADRRERDMVEYEPCGIEVVEHDAPESRFDFWQAWAAAGGSLLDLVPRAAPASGASL